MSNEITLGAIRTLRALSKNPATTIPELAELACLAKASVAVFLSKHRAAVRVGTDPRDKRRRLLTLSPEGEQLVRDHAHIVDDGRSIKRAPGYNASNLEGSKVPG